MYSKAVIMESRQPNKAKKKNLIKEYFEDFKIEFLFRKWWWSDLYYVFWDAKNRFFYGYSDKDWFEWSYEFAERNIELFKQFRDNNNSLMHKYPFTHNDRYSWESMTEEEQTEFFNMLIKCLEDMQDDGDTTARRMYGKRLWDCTKEEREKVWEERQKSINLFFETVRDRFDDFWD